jgi:hypothetical protein
LLSRRYAITPRLVAAALEAATLLSRRYAITPRQVAANTKRRQVAALQIESNAV